MNLFDDPRLTAMGLFTEAFAGLSNKINPTLAAARLSGVDFETLLRLARSPERRLRMSDLAAQTSLSTSGITRVVDRLERDGLVKRMACPHDRRASFAVVTEAGAERLQQVLPQHIRDIETSFTGLLSPDQLTQFLAALRVIRDVIRPDATMGAQRTDEHSHAGHEAH